MSVLLTLLPIIGYALVFRRIFQKNISSSIFFAITFIITVLYFFGLVEFLKIGSSILFYGGIVTLAYMLYKEKLVSAKFVISVPFVVFVLSSIVYVYLMKDSHYFFWDEYSHWGPFIKDMYSFNSFYGSHTTMSHQMYPPGMATWSYFIITNTFFSEGNVYFAYFLVLLSSVLMMYEKLSFKDIHWIVLIFGIQIIIFSGFGHWFSCIYVDHIVGAIFAGLILSYLTNEFKTKELLLFVFPLVSIVLVKEIGLYFGLSFLGLILLLEIHKRNSFKQVKLIGMLIILFLAMFLTLKSWGARQEHLGITENGQTLTTVAKNIFTNKKILSDKMDKEVKKRFWKVVKYQQLHKEKISLNYNEFSYGIMSQFHKKLKLSTIGVMLFFMGMFLVYYWTSKEKKFKTQLTIIYAYLLFVTVAYLFILYFSFQVAFGNDALRIPSFVRYMNMAVMPMLFVGFAVMLPASNLEQKGNKNNFFVVLITMLILGYIVKPYTKPLYSQLHNGFRTQVEKLTSQILKQVPAGSKLFVVFPVRNNGSLNIMLKYLLIPTKATISKYNFEKNSFPKMLQVYSKYDYVWFVTLDRNLIEKNRVFLKAKSEKSAFVLYKIQKNNNQLQIIPII